MKVFRRMWCNRTSVGLFLLLAAACEPEAKIGDLDDGHTSVATSASDGSPSSSTSAEPASTTGAAGSSTSPLPTSTSDGSSGSDTSADSSSDAGETAATDTGTASCDCGPDSCGTRQCGRSPCGYPCGSCDPLEEFCFGGTCNAGNPPGDLCRDAFYEWNTGGNVTEGDFGLRVCPTDPTMVELCTCSGGGTDAWIDCTGSCFPPCVGDIECGGEICNAAQYCQTCSGGSSSCRGRTLVADACPNPAEMVFNAFCDDDTDCAETDECMAVYGDVVRLQCARSDLFEGGCGQGSGYRELCEDAGDCTDCGTSCVPAMFADWSTPGYEVGICI